MGNGTYGSGDDGDFVDGSCGFLLEQLFDDEAADVACAYDCKLPEVGHDMGGWCVCEEASWVRLGILFEAEGVGYLSQWADRRRKCIISPMADTIADPISMSKSIVTTFLLMLIPNGE